MGIAYNNNNNVAKNSIKKWIVSENDSNHKHYQVFYFIQLNAQLCYSRLKLTLKFYNKMLLHFSVNKPSSGSLLLCFVKVMIIKIVS